MPGLVLDWRSDYFRTEQFRSLTTVLELPEICFIKPYTTMKNLAPIVGSAILLGLAAFCLYGFLATFEPTTKRIQLMAFRIGYAVVGVASLAAVCMLIVGAIRGRD